MNRRTTAEHNALASVLDAMPPPTLAPTFPRLHQDDDGPSPIAPPVMADDAFPELVRDVATIATHSSETHPVAVAANFIGLFCCAIGRTAFQRIGDATIHARPFFLVVGKSGKARKGTAEHTPREVALRADALMRTRHSTDDRLRIHTGGLSSGEGVGWALRDPREPDDKGKGGDIGVTDKRLMVVEPEFANVLAQVKREGNTLSPIIRNSWDGRSIEPLTKTSQMTATNPHMVIVGHITNHELREKSSENDAANGLLNRFLILHVQRPKLVPLPEPTPPDVLDSLAERLADAIDFVTVGNPHGNNTHEVTLGPQARAVWCELYPDISRDGEGRTGSLMARSEVYARMLAMVFALMDKRDVIEPGDLLSALAWINYWRESINYIWRNGEEQTELDEFTQAVLDVVVGRPGVKLSEIQNEWKRKRTTEVNTALELLAGMAPPLIEMRRDTTGSGRAAHRYYPVSVYSTSPPE